MFTPAGAQSRTSRPLRGAGPNANGGGAAARPRAGVSSQPAVPIAGPPSYSYGSPTNASPRTNTLKQTGRPLARLLSDATNTSPVNARGAEKRSSVLALKHSQYVDSIVELPSDEESEPEPKEESESDLDSESESEEEPVKRRGRGAQEPDTSDESELRDASYRGDRGEDEEHLSSLDDEANESTFANIKSRSRQRNRLEDVEASVNRRRSLRSASRSTAAGSPTLDRVRRFSHVEISTAGSQYRRDDESGGAESSEEEDAVLAQLDYTTRMSEEDFDQTRIDASLLPDASSSRGQSWLTRARSTLAFAIFIIRRLLSELFRRLAGYKNWYVGLALLIAVLGGLSYLSRSLLDSHRGPSRPDFTAPNQPPVDMADYATRLHSLERIVQDLGAMQTNLDARGRSDLTGLTARIDALKSSLGAQSDKLDGLERQVKSLAAAAEVVSDKLLDDLAKRLPNRIAGQIDPETGGVVASPDFWQYLRNAVKHGKDASGSEPAEGAVYSWSRFLQENERNLKEFVDVQQDERWRKAGSEGVVVSRAYFLDVLRQEMRSLAGDLDGRLKSLNVSLKQVSATLKDRPASAGGHAGLAIDQLVESAIERHSRDVLSRPDFAAYSSGGRVDPFLTSPTYMHRPTTAFGRIASSLLGNIGSSWSHPPAIALHPSNELGMCWAFAGHEGQLAIRLSHPVLLTDIAIEHVHPDIAHDVSSAPRRVEVWTHIGKDSLEAYAAATSSSSGNGGGDDGDGQLRQPPAEGYVHVMDVEYDVYAPGSMVRTFPVPASFRRLNVPTDRLVVRVGSNWGNDRFTCVYRVRAMGIRARDERAGDDGETVSHSDEIDRTGLGEDDLFIDDEAL